jgi:hypothetical protein
MLTRRTLLNQSLKLSGGLLLLPTAVGFADADTSITLRPAPGEPVKIPSNFTGLGYEMSSVAPLGLLSATNHRYVELIKGLGAQGVLRVGGIVANYTRYEPAGTIKSERQDTVITRASLEQFAAFLKTIGWTAIWSINFAQGNIAEAVEEARAVSSVLGPQLLALEIGNEVENYKRSPEHFRKPPYDYETFRTEYNQWHSAIIEAIPGLGFAAPDTASSVEWVERMAKDAKGDVQLLTTHYYRNGQTHGDADQLLHPDPRLIDALMRLRTASQQSGIPWRMCETNSFSGGGRPGVSDTFLGALWTLDFMLLLSKYGCAGVNMETGVNQLGFVSCYSPIQDDGKGVNTAGVPYYGVLAFAVARAGCTQLLPIDIDAKRDNITSYAMGSSGKPRSLIIVNRDRSQDAHISFTKLKIGTVSALRLMAPSAESTSDVTLGGASVDAEGRWKANTREHIHDGRVTLPKMSAVVLRSAG